MLLHSLISTLRNTPLPSNTTKLDDVNRQEQSRRVGSSLSEGSLPSTPVPSETQQQLSLPVPTSITSSNPEEPKLQKSIPSFIFVIVVSSIFPTGLSSLNFCQGLGDNCFMPKLSLLFS